MTGSPGAGARPRGRRARAAALVALIVGSLFAGGCAWRPKMLVEDEPAIPAASRSTPVGATVVTTAPASAAPTVPTATTVAFTTSAGATPAATPVAGAAAATGDASRPDSAGRERSVLPHLTVVAGADRETDQRMGRDLARLVAAPAGIALDVLSTKGTIDNLYRLRDDPAVDLAIVQYDVFQTFRDEAARGDVTARSIVAPVRIVAPLHTEELHFIVRRDSDLQSIDQIRGRRINVGTLGSGGALTVASLYKQLFGTPIDRSNVRYLDDRQALEALTIDRSLDVVVLVGGQPMPLLADMRPGARHFIRLLPVDPRAPSTAAAYRQYFPASIRASSYASWLQSDVPALSVMSFLVASAERNAPTDAALDALTAALCRNIGALRRDGHPKWREVDVTLKLGPGWAYRPASTRGLDRCPGDGAPATAAHASR